MQALAAIRQENQLTEMMNKMTINEPKLQKKSESFATEEEFVQQLVDITEAMVDEINNLIRLLRKGKNPEEIKYFSINEEQRSEEWHEERKIRLTGSNFKTYIHQLPVTRLKAAYDAFHKQTKEIHSKAIDYGVKYEDVARDEYVKLYPQYRVKEATLSIRTSEPWLGSSPDSLIFDENDKLIGGIEIKCPYSKKDITVEEAITLKDFYLKQTADKQIVLDDKHAYYYQVQGQMMVLDLPWVDFVVRTEKNIKVVKVNRNEVFIDYMRKELQRYYFQNYVWEILKQYARSNYLKQHIKYWMNQQNTQKLMSKINKI